MARTRRRFFRKRTVKRRRTRLGLFKRRARRFRRYKRFRFGMRRRVNGRVRRKFSRKYRGRRTMTLNAPNYSGNATVFTKFWMKPRITNAWVLPEESSPPSNRYTTPQNCLGIIQLGPQSKACGTPDMFPPIGHAGCLIVFSLDVYLRAMYSNWASVNQSTASLDADTVGVEFLRSSEELRYRRLCIDYNRQNMYKMDLIFTRKAGRSTANASFVPGYTNSASNIAAPEGTGIIGANTSTPILNNIENWLPNTGGELYWYSQAVNEHINPTLLHGRMRTGFPRDGIGGSHADAQNARITRLLQEMGSREWRKHSGYKTLKFSIKKQKGTNNQLVVEQKVGSAEQVVLSTSYIVGNENANSFDNDNSCETKNQGRVVSYIVDPTCVSYGADASNVICTLPANNGPRGSIVIWCPYSAAFLEAYYDITIVGHYQFKDKGKSILDSNVANVGDTE